MTAVTKAGVGRGMTLTEASTPDRELTLRDLWRRTGVIDAVTEPEEGETTLGQLRAAWSAARGVRTLPEIERAALVAEVDSRSARPYRERGLFAWVISGGELAEHHSVDLRDAAARVARFGEWLGGVPAGVTVIVQVTFEQREEANDWSSKTATALDLAWNDYRRACAYFQAWVVR